MIAKTLTFITDIFNQEIKMTYGTIDDRVVASSLINPDGSITENIENKIVVSIINIERETSMKMNSYFNDGDKNYGRVAPPIYLNLYLLISANYTSSNYLEATKMLSTILGVLQANSFYTRQEHPTMQEPLDKLTLEIFNVPINELSHIWSGVGAKYVPSIICKVRMMTIQKNIIKKEIPGITGLGDQAKPKTN